MATMMEEWSSVPIASSDLAGNTLTLVLKVKAEGHELKAKIVSLQYKSGPIVSAPKNKLDYQWETGRHSLLEELEQKLEINSGRAEEDGSRVPGRQEPDGD